nr:uncharacterized protein LOC127322781 [Lolium perenne]
MRPPEDAPRRPLHPCARNRPGAPCTDNTGADSPLRLPRSGDVSGRHRPPPSQATTSTRSGTSSPAVLQVSGTNTTTSWFPATRRTPDANSPALVRPESPDPPSSDPVRHGRSVPELRHLWLKLARAFDLTRTNLQPIAFASSWIGSRSGVVRYDEFSGCLSASFNEQAFPLYLRPCEDLVAGGTTTSWFPATRRTPDANSPALVRPELPDPPSLDPVRHGRSVPELRHLWLKLARAFDLT